jgi:hypothetical protein
MSPRRKVSAKIAENNLMSFELTEILIVIFFLLSQVVLKLLNHNQSIVNNTEHILTNLK